jgi:predicted DNA-binding transcriptional regulator YafY
MRRVNDTSGRLLRLLSLLQTPREWPGSELAERLQVTPRTVRRDVDRLRELGYPVQATMGTHGGYRLVAGKAMPPLLLDDEEAVAIAVGLRTAARQPVAGIAEASLQGTLCELLGQLNQVSIAVVYLNCGSPTLREAATRWAAHYYEITESTGHHYVTWGAYR